MTEMAGAIGAVSQVSDNPWLGPDWRLNQIALSKSTVRTPMQAVKQPVTLESFDHLEALKVLLLSDKLWLIISVALLILL